MMKKTMPYQRTPCFDYQCRFSEVLKPVGIVLHLFGQSIVSKSSFFYIFSKSLFFFILTFMGLVSTLGVFGRSAIDTWTQMSLYIIPMLVYPCGALIFSSKPYHRLLSRGVTDSVMVRFFVKQATVPTVTPSAHNRYWLKQMALKSLVYPLSIEFLQWFGFLVFALVKVDYCNVLIGYVHYKQINKHYMIYIWRGMYITYWSISIYLVGFISFQFIFVSRLIVKDTVSLMSLFGTSPFLNLYPVYAFAQKNACFSFTKNVINFFTMDLISSLQDEYVFTNCAQVVRHCNNEKPAEYVSTKSENVFPNRVMTSPISFENNVDCECQTEESVIIKEMTPREASELITNFISEVENLTSAFTAFTIIVSFFGVANLITHVCLFVYQHDMHGHLDSWTLFRTILFILVAVRMLFCVQHVSAILSKLPAHLKFIRCSGQLGDINVPIESWNGFFELLSSFELNKRSFGFPLTLRQVASVATVLNMTFIIVLSVFKEKS